MAYIYKITNDINNKVYVGKTCRSISERWNEHLTDYQKRKYEKRPLYAAMQKYGVSHFHIEQIEETDNPEERERFWIETLNSFHYGYNATLGGDGKPYIDRQQVVQLYNQYHCQKDVANIMGISVDSVHAILVEQNIPIISSNDIVKTRFAKSVKMLDKQKNLLHIFASRGEAAKYLIDNNLTHCKFSTIRTHISEVCVGKRQSAAGFYWEDC